MGVIVAVIMTLSSYFIYQTHRQATTHQLFEFGVSFVKFIATNLAESLLSEDWIATELYVEEVAARQGFSFINVVDRNGIIRGHSEKRQIGKTFSENKKIDILKKSNNGTLTNTPNNRVYNTVHAGQAIFGFNSTILYQNKNIGQVYLGMSKHTLKKTTDAMQYSLALLCFIGIATVSIFTYVVINRLNKPIKILKHALEEVGSGHTDYRIAHIAQQSQNNNEIKKLYATFDAMAAKLHSSHQSLVCSNDESTLLNESTLDDSTLLDNPIKK